MGDEKTLRYSDVFVPREGECWLQTYSGKAFILGRPIPGMLDFEDVARSLAMINRYNGHTTRPLSVAAHSVALACGVLRSFGSDYVKLGALLSSLSSLDQPNSSSKTYIIETLHTWRNSLGLTDAQLFRSALLHDAHEAFVGDVPKPIRGFLGAPWERFECRIQAFVRNELKVCTSFDTQIKMADWAILRTERELFMHKSRFESCWELPPKDTMPPCFEKTALEVYRLTENYCWRRWEWIFQALSVYVSAQISRLR